MLTHMTIMLSVGSLEGPATLNPHLHVYLLKNVDLLFSVFAGLETTGPYKDDGCRRLLSTQQFFSYIGTDYL